MKFVLIEEQVWHIDNIIKVDFSRVEDLVLKVFPRVGQPLEVEGIQAIDLLMTIKPSALESRRLRWKKRAWMVHNLLGHPLMQAAALLGQYRLAMFIHDITVPRPRGRK